MIARLSRPSNIDRVRRNHALEHASISVITERQPTVLLAGRSNAKGFYIFGAIDTAELRSAVDEGLLRLLRGEVELAIHPRCGTNLAVAGILTGLSAAFAAQLKPHQNRYSYAVLASLAALAVAPRVGTVAQRHLTTLAQLGDLEVLSVEQRRLFWMRDTVHWVRTRST